MKLRVNLYTSREEYKDDTATRDAVIDTRRGDSIVSWETALGLLIGDFMSTYKDYPEIVVEITKLEPTQAEIKAALKAYGYEI